MVYNFVKQDKISCSSFCCHLFGSFKSLLLQVFERVVAIFERVMRFTCGKNA